VSNQPDIAQHVITDPIMTWGEARRDLQRFLLQRCKEFRLPADVSIWAEQAEALRRQILQEVVYKGHPEEIFTSKPQIDWRETIQTDYGYAIRKLRYEAFPGMWFPAIIYVPDKISGKIPGVLNVVGHHYPLGKAYDEEQIRCINLAKRGMIAIHPEWLSCGELNIPGFRHDNIAFFDLCGVAGVSLFYLNMKKALDILVDMPEVDSERVAMTGLSGGGWQTIFLSALDTRIKASIPAAGYITENRRIFYINDIGDLEQTPADLHSIADFDTLTAMLAPRPALLIFNTFDDCCFQAHRAKPTVYDPVLALYEKLGIADRFEWHANDFPGTHNYGQDNREAMYRFLNKHFLAGQETIDEDIPCANELKSMEELAAGVPKGNADYISVAREMACALPKRSTKPASLDEERAALKAILRSQADAVCKAELRTETQVDGKAVRSWLLHLGSEFRLPVVEYTQTDPAAPVALVGADKGRAETAALVAQLWAEGKRVIAFDVLLAGDLAKDEIDGWYASKLLYRFPILLSTSGFRPLGMQATQIASIIDWVKADKACELYAQGHNLSVAALCATALDEKGQIGKLVTRDMPASLKALLDEKYEFWQNPLLYCFGLLEKFDIDDLLALCAGRELDCQKVDL
jgi:hypothetical protein